MKDFDSKFKRKKIFFLFKKNKILIFFFNITVAFAKADAWMNDFPDWLQLSGVPDLRLFAKGFFFLKK